MDKIQENVNHWLRHAESKHAVLIGFLIGVITLMFNFIPIKLTSINIVSAWVIWTVLLFSIALLLSLYSFIPILNILRLKNTTPLNEEINPYFFADIACLTPGQFLEMLGIENDNKIVIWQAHQIVANSRIAVRKFKLFEKAIWIVFFGLMPPIALIIIVVRSIIQRKRNNGK